MRGKTTAHAETRIHRIQQTTGNEEGKIARIVGTNGTEPEKRKNREKQKLRTTSVTASYARFSNFPFHFPHFFLFLATNEVEAILPVARSVFV